MLSQVGTVHDESYLPRPRCCVKSPTAQDVFQPIPGLVSYAGVTGGGECYLLHNDPDYLHWS